MSLFVGLFLSILVAVFGAGYLFLRGRGTEETMISSAASGSSDTRKDGVWAVLLDTLRVLGEAFPGAPGKREPLQHRLAYAGYRAPQAASVFQGLRLTAALAFGLLACGVAMLSQEGNFNLALVAGIGLGGFAYLAVERGLAMQIGRRRRELRRGLPNALDLMVLSVEAGQGLDQTCVEVGRQMRRSYPALAQEFVHVHLELRTGASRLEALRSMGQRTGEPEMRKIAQILIEGDRFGANLAPTLRNHAKYLRVRMRQQAQEQARKVGVKLVFPLVLLIFPALMLAILGPAVVDLMTMFRKFGTGF